MPLHNLSMDNFALLKALASEERARNASDPAVKREWEALAIEWHLLATMIAKATTNVSHAKSAWRPPVEAVS